MGPDNSHDTQEEDQENNRFKRSEVLQRVGNESEVNDRQHRRKFLGALAGVAVALGFSGAAKAIDLETARKEEFKRLVADVEDRFASGAAKARAFDKHGGEVLQWAADRGYIDNLDPTNLDYSNTVVSAVFYGDIPTTQLTFKKDIEPGRLRIVIQPEVDRQYAIIRPENQTQDGVIFDPAKSNSAQTLLCPWGFACIACCCACQNCEVYCCESGCYTSNCEGECCNCDYPNCRYVCG